MLIAEARKYLLLHPVESKVFIMSDKKIKIILKKSSIGSKKNQIASLRGLGLRKTNSSVVRDSSPEILGMIKVVNHLVSVEEI